MKLQYRIQRWNRNAFKEIPELKSSSLNAAKSNAKNVAHDNPNTTVRVVDWTGTELRYYRVNDGVLQTYDGVEWVNSDD